MAETVELRSKIYMSEHKFFGTLSYFLAQVKEAFGMPCHVVSGRSRTLALDY